MTTNSFMAEFILRTCPNPFADFERVWASSTAFEIKPCGHLIRLGCIRSLVRGRGLGTVGLVWLCLLARLHGVCIEGDIQPVGKQRPRLNANQLKAWYRRHGFQVDGRKIMYRPPRLEMVELES